MPQLLLPLLTTVGIPGLVTAAGTSTFLGSVVTLGLSVGLSLLSGLLIEKPKPENVKATVRQSVASRTGHMGLVCGGGSLAAIEDENGNLHQVIVFGQCEGGFEGFETWIVDEREVTLDGSGWVIEAPFNGDTVRIDYRLGTNSQTAFAGMISALPTIWTSAHQLNGLACAHVYQDGVAEERFPDVYRNRITQVKWVARTAKLFDPRNDSTAFSKNLALMFRQYATSINGARIDPTLIDDDTISAAAAIADESLTTKLGDVIGRYHGSLSYSFSEKPKDVLDRIILACDGRSYLTPAGKIGFQVGAWVEPTVTITDKHILGHNLRRGNGPYVEKNEIVIRYTAPDTRFSQATSDPWRDQASIDAYGLRTAAIEAFEIQHHNHARRIAKILQRRSAPKWAGTVVTDLFGMQAWDQRWINLTIAVLGIEEESFEVLAIEPNRRANTVTLQLASFEADAYDFVAAEEEGTPQAIPDEIDNDGIEAPAFVLTGYQVRVVQEITVPGTATYDPGPPPTVVYGPDQVIQIKAAFIQIDWPDPTRSGLRPEVQFQRDGYTWQPVPVAVGTSVTETEGQKEAGLYHIRVHFVTIGGTPSDWTDGPDLTIPLLT